MLLEGLAYVHLRLKHCSLSSIQPLYYDYSSLLSILAGLMHEVLYKGADLVHGLLVPTHLFSLWL